MMRTGPVGVVVRVTENTPLASVVPVPSTSPLVPPALTANTVTVAPFTPLLVATPLTTTPDKPVPVSVIIWGPPSALSVMVIVPARSPLAVGENVMLMVQLAPTATDPPQSLVAIKLALGVMLEILRVAPPLLVSVTV